MHWIMIPAGTRKFFGRTWACSITPHADYKERQGILLEVCQNLKWGLIALCYATDEYLEVDSALYEGLLRVIREYSSDGRPIVLCTEERYRDLCAVYDDGCCTVMAKDELLDAAKGMTE